MGFLKNVTLTLFLITLVLAAINGATARTSSSEHQRRALVSLTQKVHVDIWNRMSGGVELTAHCKSKDDDLGIVGAGPDVAVSFNFKTTLLGTTLFHCALTSTHGVIRFAVYDYARDFDNGRCKSLCTWNVRDDGVHGVVQQTGVEDVVFPWAPGSSLAN